VISGASIEEKPGLTGLFLARGGINAAEKRGERRRWPHLRGEIEF